MPSQSDDEAHQLSYLQKHVANIVALLAEPAEGQGDESLILTMERFEHLGFLIQFEKGCDLIPLSQAAPFFANSDPDMPAAPVSAVQVHDWISQNITTTLEHNTDKTRAKENGPSTALDADVTMADASPSHPRDRIIISPNGSSMQSNPSNSRSQTFVEGISKASLVKQPFEIKGHSVKVLNCHDSVIYLLAPLRYAIVYGCSHATVILGAIGKVAPFNTYYAQLGEHLAHAGVDSAINKWDDPLVLGVVDPHDSLSHPAGTSDVQAESAACLDPEQFTNFWIPNWSGAGSSQLTRYNPFSLPSVYVASQRSKHLLMADIQNAIRDLQIDESRRRELACALHMHFKDWLYASGNIRQLYCLQGD